MEHNNPTIQLPARWKILLIEDDEEDRFLVNAWLREIRVRKVELDWVATYADGHTAALQQPYDAILIDYGLGAANGLDLTRELVQGGCEAPILLLTGLGDYELDLLAMKSGASDYLSKSEATPQLLERAIRYAIERKATEAALRQANESLARGRDLLEERVRERTKELVEKNLALETEFQRRKLLEAELVEMRRRLIDRAEGERIEIARELHDGPMQELYGLNFELADLKESMLDAGLLQRSMQYQEKLLKVIQELRSIAGELRPPALAPFGLQKAIQTHASSFQEAHPSLQVNLELDNDGQRLPETARLALFRTYQVALVNVIRHASATQVTVRLKVNPDCVTLEVSDNGKGFEVPQRWIQFAREGHLGLAGAAERAEASGGRLEVDSAPGRGTRLVATIPLSPFSSEVEE